MQITPAFRHAVLPTLALTGALALSTINASAQTSAKPEKAEMKTAAAEGFNAADKKLIMAAAESDETEISAAKLAEQKSSSAPVKEYAQMMVKDHTKSTTMLKPIAEAAGVPMPDLKMKHKAMAAELEALSGDAFDKAYIKGNVKSHKEILSTMQKSMADLSNPELKKFAATVTPIVEHHLMMAENMEKSIK